MIRRFFAVAAAAAAAILVATPPASAINGANDIRVPVCVPGLAVVGVVWPAVPPSVTC